MNVAADDAIGVMAAGHGSERAFVFGDEFDGGLGLEFQKRRERPVAETKRAAQAVEVEVEVENPVVKVRAELFEEVIEMRQAVRLMAVDDEILLAVGGGMDGLPRHLHAAEAHADELLDELVWLPLM